MTELRLDDDAPADLRTFATRARRLDADGALRLVVAGGVLAAYAAALHGTGGPTVLGLRTHRAAAPEALDITVSAAALLDRLAGTGPGGVVPLPDLTPPRAAWAGLLPPRTGWTVEGLVSADVLVTAATEGIAEVAAGTPEGAGSAAVSRLRALVWGRDLPGSPGLPAGAAFAADAFGFLRRDAGGAADAVTLHRAGPWRRLSTSRGHVLARAGLL